MNGTLEMTKFQRSVVRGCQKVRSREGRRWLTVKGEQEGVLDETVLSLLWSHESTHTMELQRARQHAFYLRTPVTSRDNLVLGLKINNML